MATEVGILRPTEQTGELLGKSEHAEHDPKTSYNIPPFGDSSALDSVSVDGSCSPLSTPIIQPSSVFQPAPPGPLGAKESSLYDTLLSQVIAWTNIPNSSASKEPGSPLNDSERMWLTRECLLRYLRASSWNVATAAKRLEATISWRRGWGLENHTADYISPENETGKQVILGYDLQGRPCLYLNPHRQNTKDEKKQVEHLVFMLERCIDLMPPGQETLALLINFRECRKGENASMAQSKQVLQILQNHFPERLGKAYVQQVPWLIWGFFKAISLFIDPQTKTKIQMDAKLRDVIPPQQLLKSSGGDLEFEYEHAKYWPALIALATTRKTSLRERWLSKGGVIGESEWYMKGGEGYEAAVVTEANGS